MSSPADAQRGLAAYASAQAHRAAGRLADAAGQFQRALALLPHHPDIVAAYAQLADEVQDWRAAETLWRRLASLRPQANAEPRLAMAIARQERHAEAIGLLRQCTLRTPQDAGLWQALGAVLGQAGLWEESLAATRQSLVLRADPGALLVALSALYQLGHVEELDAELREAVARYPDHRGLLALYGTHCLRAGRDLPRAFALLPVMRAQATGGLAAYDTDAAGLPWDGQPFDGLLRVVADGGIGDQLLGASLFDDLVATGQRALVLCDGRLLPLFRRRFPSLQFLARDASGQAEALAGLDAARDRRINAIDLGRFFRQDAAAFPSPHAWLVPDPERTAALRADYAARWAGRRRVGISWKSSRRLEAGADKGVALATLAPLLARPDCVFVSLQYGDVRDEIAALEASHGLRVELDARIDSLVDLDGFAAQVAALDHVVTTSNTTAHVAGALGQSADVLLPAVRPVLWYWGYAGDRTPWYPSLRLRRCPVDGDWAAALAETARDLA